MNQRETTVVSATNIEEAVVRYGDLIVGKDPRTATWLFEEPSRVAATKLMFMTTPDEYRDLVEPLQSYLSQRYSELNTEEQVRLFSFAVLWAESFHSPVDLSHNLTSDRPHKNQILSDTEIEQQCQSLLEWVESLSQQNPSVEKRFLSEQRDYTFAVNSAKGLNLFKRSAERWLETGRDPFGCIREYLAQRASLFARGNYYVDLYFSFSEGKSITQFFNDYGEQAEDCRKIGSLGGTTNPVIATLGEDDLPGKWGEARRKLVEIARSEGYDDEWAATAFTELVVFNAQLAQRPVFLLKRLGRISFQLRTDKAEDVDYLLSETPEIYARLCERLQVVDEILLEGSDPSYQDCAHGARGVSNNHFKVSVSGPAALRALTEFNSGNNRLDTRLFTNATVTHDLSQITAALDATLAGAEQWERRTGEPMIENDGHFGSVVTSMMGRYVDAMRARRIQQLSQSLGSDDPWTEKIQPCLSGKIPLTSEPLNQTELVDALRSRSEDYRPDSEEDAIRNVATLITKIAILYAIRKYGEEKGNRLLSASKRFFQMNTDLENGHRFSTDFGDIQAESIDVTYQEQPDPWAGFDKETGEVIESEDNPWWQRIQEIRRIFPEAERHLTPGGITPEEWMDQPYNQATMKEFTAKWWLNVERARQSVELLDGQYRGPDGQDLFAEKCYGHMGDRARSKAWLWARSFLQQDEFQAMGWTDPTVS